MSNQFFLDETDIDILINLLLRSQQSRTREALCVSIGIDPKRLSFIRDSSESDFFLLLIKYLNEIGEQEALCKLCCKELIPVFRHGKYAPILSDIAAKLNCNQKLSQNFPNSTQPTVLSSIPVSRVSVNPFNQLAKNKLVTGGAILLIVLAVYPAYEHFKQLPQLLENQVLQQQASLVKSEKEGNIGEYREGVVPVKSVENVNLRNFIVEAEFDNPYDGAIDNWTYGFAFNDTTTDNLNDPKRKGFDIWVSSKKKEWGFNSPGTSTSGNLSNLNLSDKSSNKLRLTVKDKKAKFFVNDIYIETLDISELTNKGKVFLTAGNGISGKSVQYKNLRVWSLDN